MANNGYVEFVGTWKYFEDVIVILQGSEPAPQPNPVPPVNLGGEQGADNNQVNRLQPRKPEENPPAQSPAGEKAKQATLPNTGSTAPLSLTGLMTSSLLAGLGALLLGRKRKND